MNNRFLRALKWLARKPVNAWRSLPVRLVLIFFASFFVITAATAALFSIFPPQGNPENMTVVRVLGYPTIAVVFVGCYLAVRRLFYPLEDIRQGTRRIGEGQLEYRIPIRRQDELGRLTQRINRMADQVKGMLDGQRELLLAMSHELRTPLTRARLALEFIHDKDVRSHLEYDLSSMERMITELLEGERLNTQGGRMSRSRVNLNKLMAEVLRGDFPNDRHRVSLSVPPSPAHLSVNAARLRMLVRNLVENALRYNPRDGMPVELSLRMEDGAAVIRVQDHGPGIEPEHLERVTGAFYRADPSRGAGTGRHGLGLYLCRLIAEAHGGEVEVASPPGSGACITARIPGEPPD
ncbi:MAG: HAMP domain-containing histidine kinase [Gammaproteobacteria bacterium]|nr:HAMP domain-containing histidine kinase [Gammaproteobacteria bacterium]MYF67577.1 HAMP domain-containing histidine kinase [Gammaproteobacteria bacterium]MYK38317.1 HAMP domain-containing histidine kinase [Gammaproteobacteria bacterium]